MLVLSNGEEGSDLYDNRVFMLAGVTVARLIHNNGSAGSQSPPIAPPKLKSWGQYVAIVPIARNLFQTGGFDASGRALKLAPVAPAP